MVWCVGAEKKTRINKVKAEINEAFHSIHYKRNDESVRLLVKKKDKK